MRRITLGTISLFVFASGMATAQSNYNLPPPEVVKILDTPQTPSVVVSPTRDALLLVDREGYPPIQQLARPILRLAGVRISPDLGALQRTFRFTGIEIVPLDGRPRKRVELPAGSKIGLPKWSPAGSSFAFTRDLPDGVELWVFDVAKGHGQAIPGVRIVDVLSGGFDGVRGFQWTDDRHLLIHQIPSGRGATPKAPDAPTGPNTEETKGKVGQVATYQDLLKSPRDEELFRYFAINQLARVDPSTGAVTAIGEPGLIAYVEPSPDGKFLLVTTLKAPFSYRVPCYLFPRSIEVLNAKGQPVRKIADLPVSDDTPRQGVPKGPRSVEWQPLFDATLIWAEALDGGDPIRKVPYRDKLMSLAAPFKDEPSAILKTQHRFTRLNWTAKPGQAMLTQFDRNRRWNTTALIELADPSHRRVVFDLSINDAYKNPGTPLTQVRPDGQVTLLQDGDVVYLLGRGASEAGDRPFLDAMNLKTLQK
jgi:dipeptidyl aminopeptidase/acylaminoacyl peptidase